MRLADGDTVNIAEGFKRWIQPFSTLSSEFFSQMKSDYVASVLIWSGSLLPTGKVYTITLCVYIIVIV